MDGGSSTAPLDLLLAEDSENDALFFRLAVEKSQLTARLSHVWDGEEAIAYLRGEGRYADRKVYPFPKMLFTDLKMPKADGYDVLRWLRDHPVCRVIPTIIISSSYLPSDVHASYVLGANAFIAKPSHPTVLSTILQDACRFWSHCQLPAPPPGEKCP